MSDTFDHEGDAFEDCSSNGRSLSYPEYCFRKAFCNTIPDPLDVLPELRKVKEKRNEG